MIHQNKPNLVSTLNCFNIGACMQEISEVKKSPLGLNNPVVPEHQQEST